jgi:hypothetical protein
MIIHGTHDGKSGSELLVDLFELGVLNGLDEQHSEEDDDKK